MHLGFTGTQKGLSDIQAEKLEYLLAYLRDDYEWMHNGDCIGADETAAKLWLNLDGKIHLHPPIKSHLRAFVSFDKTEEKLDYLARNRKIVDASQLLIGTPLTLSEELRSGTWSTIRYARKIKKPVILVYPNGIIDPIKFEKR